MKHAYLTFPYSHKSPIVRWWRWYKSIRLKQDFAFLDGWADLMLIPIEEPYEKSKGIALEQEYFKGEKRAVLNDGTII
uniref:Uncharacterized protein n=1 Tax=viral metagenome TaxID=1070528 RepID=A0A6M3IJF7_9ZZZZ